MSTSNAILVGEAPSRNGDAFYEYPLSGPPSRVLCRLAGIDPWKNGTTYGRWYWALRERFLAVNLFERHADAEPWSAPRARERAAWLLDQLPPVSVLLGVRVAAAFDVADHGMFVPVAHRCEGVERRLVVVPHPSGLNRLYNDPEQRARAGDCLRWAMAEAAR